MVAAERVSLWFVAIGEQSFRLAWICYGHTGWYRRDVVGAVPYDNNGPDAKAIVSFRSLRGADPYGLGADGERECETDLVCGQSWTPVPTDWVRTVSASAKQTWFADRTPRLFRRFAPYVGAVPYG